MARALASLAAVMIALVPVARADEVGVPTTCDPGITETVAEIMARDAATPAEPPARPRATHSLVYPARDGLPLNPASPAVPKWPWDGRWDTTMLPAPAFGQRSPQTLGLNFQGADDSESGFIPPDTMGDVGPTQILMCVNGRIKTFSKTTGAVDGALNTTTNTFFNSVRNASTTSDPRVVFDRISQRWFVLMINVTTPNRILIAVSSNATITSSSSFQFFQFTQDAVGTTPNADTGALADYPSLGVDANALYTGSNMFAGGTTFNGTSVWVINKANLLAGTLTVTPFRQVVAGAAGAGPYAPRGVTNDDPAATEGYFIGPDRATFGTLMIRRISTPGGTPTISANISVAVPATTAPLSVPAQGSTTNVEASDDRIYDARIHLNRVTGVRTLWCAHSIQVNSSGVASSTGGRNGGRWYQLQNLTTTPSLAQSGTLFDSAATNPRYYSYSTAAMSGQGHMAIGASFGGAANFMSAAAAGRLHSDSAGSTQAPTTIIAGAGSYTVLGNGRNRWGDYSSTVVDPCDDQTLWTFQEDANATNSWGVQITRLLAPPPAAITTLAPNSLAQGATSNVTVTGTSASGSAFYDTDATYCNRIAAAFSGTGITVNTVTRNSDTQVTLNVTVGGAATTGLRNLTITNPDGQAVTGTNVFTVTTGGCTGPTVTNPSDVTVCSGGSATFSVSATGTAPLNFQWRKNTVNVGGATASSLTINPVATGDAGSYDCVVTNACGTATSTAAVLTVNTAPAITTQPNSQSACSGSNVTFTVAASGSPAPTFQWRKNGSNLVGQTSSSLTLTGVTPLSAGTYDCVATNTCGSATSNGAVLTINTAPSVTTNPSSQTVCIGGTANFVAAGSGSPAPTFQWRKNGSNIPGATGSTYAPPVIAFTDAGNYDCVLTNACGTATTTAAVLTVNEAPLVTNNPASITRCTGTSASFTATASGVPAPTFQWRKNLVNIPGATSGTYTIPSVVTGDAGSYDCVVTNSCGSATSSAATLTVNTAPAITGNPSSQSVCSGGSASFSVSASGTPAPTFQWRKNAANIGGATSATLTINPVGAGDAGSYDCVVTNSCGSATSSAASLTVNTAPAITGNPSNQTVCSGGSASFTVTASGSPAPTFQWRKNAANIGGATSSTLTINPVGAGDVGSYDCVVTNPCGSATSSAASLTVNDVPSIITQPASQSHSAGSPASFTVVASSAAPLSYQWRKAAVNLSDGGTISGSLTSTLSISAVVLADAGNYDCLVSNLCGTTNTNVATLTVTGCLADVDDGTFTGTPDGGVTLDDLLYYLFIFDNGFIAADVDDGTFTGTPDGGVTLDDLLYFLYRFDLGC